LGEKVGVTFYTVSNWELGIKQPRFKNLRALAEALSIQPEQIILTQGKGVPDAAA
jgi:transcriptional regulator with XRE-family HTH domain